MKAYYDIIVIGASKVGLDYLKNADTNATKCLVSKDLTLLDETLTTVDCLNNEVVYMNYNHGLTILELADHTRVCGVNIIVATEAKPNCKSEFYYKNEHKLPNKAENIAIFGNSDEAANIAIGLAKFAKNVYILSSDNKMKMSPGERLKVVNTKNIYWMPLSKDIKLVEDKNTYKIILDQDEIICHQIFDFPDRIPDTDFVPNNLVQKDKSNYILVDKNNKTTIIPTIYAIGSCAKLKEEN